MANRKIKFENWAQYTRDARSFIPIALGHDEIWTQGTLASLLGVDSNYVSMIERRDKEPGKRFKITIGYLIKMAQNGIDPRSV